MIVKILESEPESDSELKLVEQFLESEESEELEDSDGDHDDEEKQFMGTSDCKQLISNSKSKHGWRCVLPKAETPDRKLKFKKPKTANQDSNQDLVHEFSGMEEMTTNTGM